jgi:hypothetical protein
VVAGVDRPADKERWREGTLLVGMKPGVPEASAKQLHDALGSEKLQAFPELRLQVVKLRAGLSVEEAVKRYSADPRVAYAEPDYRVSVQATPDDPRFGDLWGLHNLGWIGGTPDADIDAPEAWNVTTGSAGVVVAVLDTGIDTTHPDLAANLWVNPGEIEGNGIDDDGNGYIDDIHGINAINHSGDPWDDHGHGTHVAGTIGAAGNNAIGVVGVNWNVRIVACKFLDANGNGYDSGALTCLQYVKRLWDYGAPIVASSNSWGGSGYSQALADAINTQHDVLFVAAAGNNTQNNDYAPFYPASYQSPNVISVAASDFNDGLAGFSNFGRGSVLLAAPGASVLSTLPEVNYWNLPGRYGYLSGTSMATPHVAGVAALLKAADPSRDWRSLRNLLLSGADPLPSLENKTITGRRLNAFGSISCANRHLLRAVPPPYAVEVGVPVTLKVLSITCGSSAGPVAVTTSQGETFHLLDDGVAPDAVASDGVFTGTWIPLRNPEKLSISSPAGISILRVPPPYIGHYLADGNTRAPYAQSLTAFAAVAPIGWSIVAGDLPTGLVLNGTTGEISGQPTDTGTFAFTVRLTDAWGLDMTRPMTIRVGNGDIKEDFARTLHEGAGADGRALQVDGSGNVYVLGSLGELAGWIGGTDWTGIGKNYLAKYDSSGSLVWLKRYTTGFLRAIKLDASGAIYAAGGTSVWDTGDTLLVKFDSSGNALWSRTYNNGSATDVAMDLALGPGGAIFLGGVSDVFPAIQMYIQKLDASGNPLWFRAYSNGVADYGYAIGTDASGNAYLGGSSAAAIPNPGGGYIYAYDYVVRKYDPSGNLVWSRSYDTGAAYDFLAGLGVTGSGDVYVLGHPDQASYNAFVTIKFAADGSLRWVRNYHSTSHLPSALAIDGQENVYVSGGSWGEGGTNDWDFLTLKYDRLGNLLWKKDTDARYYLSQYDGDFAMGVAVDPLGRIYTTGFSHNGVDGKDMLLVRYSSSPGPGEANEAQHMTAARGLGQKVNVTYEPGCGATNHVIVWGTGPPIGDGVSWSHIVCSRGTSGSTDFDPGTLAPGTFVYFVVVAQDEWSEGSYGRDSSGQERLPIGIGSCYRPPNLEACAGP